MSKRGRPIKAQKSIHRISQTLMVDVEQMAYLAHKSKAQAVSKAEIVRAALTSWMQHNSVIAVSQKKLPIKESSAQTQRCMFHFEPEQVDYLNRIASATTNSKSTIVREALSAWILANPLPLSANESED